LPLRRGERVVGPRGGLASSADQGCFQSLIGRSPAVFSARRSITFARTEKRPHHRAVGHHCY
jgi:hypothetical protein